MSSNLLSLGSNGIFGQKYVSTVIESKSSTISPSNYLMKSLGIPKYGLVLTSISQVLKSSSTIKSYPNNSKQFFLLLGFNDLLALKNVSIIQSLILEIICDSILTPYSLNVSSKYLYNSSRLNVLPGSCYPYKSPCFYKQLLVRCT